MDEIFKQTKEVEIGGKNSEVREQRENRSQVHPNSNSASASIVEELLGHRLLVSAKLVLLRPLHGVKVPHDNEQHQKGEEDPNRGRPVVGPLDGVDQREDEKEQEHAGEDATELEVLPDHRHDAEEVEDEGDEGEEDEDDDDDGLREDKEK